MFHSQGSSKQTCTLLVVTCGKVSESKRKKDVLEDRPIYPFPELISSGRLEVQTLNSLSREEVCRVIESFKPNLVYLQGEQLDNDEVGTLVWGDGDLSNPEAVSELFGATLPTTVYLEMANGEELAEELQAKGVPYVIYWKHMFSCQAACHFHQALLSVVNGEGIKMDTRQVAGPITRAKAKRMKEQMSSLVREVVMREANIVPNQETELALLIQAVLG